MKINVNSQVSHSAIQNVFCVRIKRTFFKRISFQYSAKKCRIHEEKSHHLDLDKRIVKILRRDFHRDYSSRKGGRDTKYI
jgi:hypothetical protein